MKKHPALINLMLCLVVGAAFTLSGCVITTYKHPGGAEFTRLAVGSTQNVGEVDVTTAAGDKLKITGYSSESAQTAAAVVSAAVSAAKK